MAVAIKHLLATGYWQLLYHFSVHALAERLLQTIRKQELIRAGDRVAVAVSAGADSVALLHLLVELRPELGMVLSVAHVNHKLRGEESEEDQRFVASLAQQLGLELHLCAVSVAAGRSSGIEATARKQRYDFFRQLAHAGLVTKTATAHTLDDQAETVLLRLFRGTGIRGLSGIHPRIIIAERGELIRPLLGLRRAALQKFLREQGQSWREDSSNRDISFLRNRVRHRLLPIIAEEFGEAAIEHMSELTEIARAEEQHWLCGHPEIAPMPSTAKAAPGDKARPAASLRVGPLLTLPLAAQRRLIRAWLETNALNLSGSFRLIEQALELARAPAGKKMELPGAFPKLNLRRGREELVMELEPARGDAVNYEYTLAVPGTVEVPELGACIEARVVDVLVMPENAHGQLLDFERMPRAVLIRNWRPGDRFWPSHTAAAKKVKDLLSEQHAAGVAKKLWPVAVAEGTGLIWIRGFAVPAALHAPAGAVQAIWIREIPGMM